MLSKTTLIYSSSLPSGYTDFLYFSWRITKHTIFLDVWTHGSISVSTKSHLCYRYIRDSLMNTFPDFDFKGCIETNDMLSMLEKHFNAFIIATLTKE